MADKFTPKSTFPGIAGLLRLSQDNQYDLAPRDLYMLLLAAQLTVTHPNLSKSMRDMIESAGRRCQDLLRPNVNAFMAEFLEAGWHREHDR